SPTTSPDPYSKPADSDPNYTVNHEEPDIGMVFTEDEKTRISKEGSFDTYLRHHPEHYLAFRESGELSDSIAEGYCRWRHPDRVYDFLSSNALDQEWFKWGKISIRNYLGKVCQSHGYPADDLKSDEFTSDFLLGECDLRFCAIILRIADILDFDNSRSPDSIYRALGIGMRADPRTAESDIEWRKHLSSEGFKFGTNRDGSRSLQLQCGPDNPAVESDVRNFIDVIDQELAFCQRIIRYCSDRWSDFVLPTKVDRRGIISQGYKYGEFRFDFDRESILELFMGERLYGDPLVFIRELIQNAIDATQARSLISGTNSVDAGWEINCSSWTDKDGRQWIRIDDNGIGMNQYIVENFLLKIGRSYYLSKEFQADVVRTGIVEKPSIVSIGRFGVGLLSVFMVGDLVELSTRRQLADSRVDAPLRMSFNELSGFAIVQEPPDTPHPFPGPVGPEFGYRSQPGTSIAVRIDPRKFSPVIHLDQLVRSHLLGTAVPVRVNGNLIEDGRPTSWKDAPTQSFDVPVQWNLETVLETLRGQLDAELPQDIIDGILDIKVRITTFKIDPAITIEGLSGRGFVVSVDARKLTAATKSLALSQFPGFKNFEEWNSLSGASRMVQESMFKVAFDSTVYLRPIGVPNLPLSNLKLNFFDRHSSVSRLVAALRQELHGDIEEVGIEELRLKDDVEKIYGSQGESGIIGELRGVVDWQQVLDRIGFHGNSLHAWSHNGVRLPRPSTSSYWMEYRGSS
ncbi:hypothetical protein ACJH6H_29610, partial [Mycobacterium sp. SMC-21]